MWEPIIIDLGYSFFQIAHAASIGETKAIVDVVASNLLPFRLLRQRGILLPMNSEASVMHMPRHLYTYNNAYSVHVQGTLAS